MCRLNEGPCALLRVFVCLCACVCVRVFVVVGGWEGGAAGSLRATEMRFVWNGLRGMAQHLVQWHYHYLYYFYCC